uniref:Uncharacterized protein n=1 Tax=viral metagenome TaxID=1070528 RepID=A0A6C0AVP4_9ZZZZ|tara:strand:- start:8439 stop:9998 length:1560 start_codon:yes stop_codon:yes gene_type:complete
MYKTSKNTRIKRNKINKKKINFHLIAGTPGQEEKQNIYRVLADDDVERPLSPPGLSKANSREKRIEALKKKFALYDDKQAAHSAAYNAIIANEDRHAAQKAAQDATDAANLRGEQLSNLEKPSLEILLGNLEKEKNRIENATNKILMELDKKKAEEVATAAMSANKDREAASDAAMSAKLAAEDRSAAAAAASSAAAAIQKRKRIKKRNKLAAKRKQRVLERKEADSAADASALDDEEQLRQVSDMAELWESKISDYMNKFPILRISAIKMTQHVIDPNYAPFLDKIMNEIIQIDEIMQNEGVSWRLATIYYDKPNMPEKEKKEMVKHDIVLSSMTPEDERHGDEENIRPKMTESDKNIHELMRKYRISRKTAKIFHENPDWSEDKKSRVSAEDPVTQDAKMREFNINRDSAKDLLSNPTDDIDTWKKTLSKDPFFQKKIEDLMNEFHCSYDTAMFMLIRPNATEEEIDEILRNDKTFVSHSNSLEEHALFLKRQADIKLKADQKKAKSKAKRQLRRRK